MGNNHHPPRHRLTSVRVGKERHRIGTLRSDYRYTGQRWDERLGLYDYNARYYDPTLGRFLSADSLVPGTDYVALTTNFAELIPPNEDADSAPLSGQFLSRFTYVANSPVMNTDPSGHIQQSILVKMSRDEAEQIGTILLDVLYAVEQSPGLVRELIVEVIIPAVAGGLAAKGVELALGALGISIAGAALVVLGIVVSIIVSIALGFIHSESLENAEITLERFLGVTFEGGKVVYTGKGLLGAIAAADSDDWIYIHSYFCFRHKSPFY